ncbi:Transcription factor 25, partial [Apophysomyces ossiformis]
MIVGDNVEHSSTPTTALNMSFSVLADEATIQANTLRRLQKQQLAELEHKSDEEEEQVFIQPSQRKVHNAFALLNDGDDDDNDTNEIAEQPEKQEESEEEIQIKSEPSQRKKKKNKKKKKSKATDASDMSMQELEKVLQEVTGSTVTDTHEADQHHENADERKQLLNVQYRYLDAEAEMKRMFGSRVVNTERRATGSVEEIKVGYTQGGLATLCTPRPLHGIDRNKRWYAEQRSLGEEKIDTQAFLGISYFTFKHDEEYQDTQLEFLNAVATYNPNSLVLLTHRRPYHIDSLLQLSEVAKHSGDWTVAGDCIGRAWCISLFTAKGADQKMEKNVLYMHLSALFILNSHLGVETSFFLAIFRHIQFLTRRGCWRTAFEFNKLLFSLDPDTDPLGSLLSMDYYALSAKDHNYVLSMLKGWKTSGDIYPIELDAMPNFAYSGAYAQFKFTAEKHRGEQDVKCQSSKMLQDAITKHPFVALHMLDKIGDSEPSAHKNNWLSAQTLPNPYLELLQRLFVERAAELWKEPEASPCSNGFVISWLKANLRFTLQNNDQGGVTASQYLDCAQKDQVPLSVSRHTILSDIQSVLTYVPSSVTSTSYHMYDPLPPPDSETGYDINNRLRTRGVGRTRGGDETRGGLMGMIRQLLHYPDGRPVPPAEIFQMIEEMNNREGAGIPGEFPHDEEGDEEELEGT